MELFLTLVSIFTPIAILLGLDLLKADGNLRRIITECCENRSTK
jgi:hypothetical protein